MLLRTFGVAGALVLIGAAAASLASSLLFTSAQSVDASALPPASAAIVRTTLEETKTVTGVLSFGELTPVRAIVDAGAGRLTWLAPEGAVVERGEPLFAIDGSPAVLLYGDTPFFRTLRFHDDSFESVEWVEFEDAQDDVREADLNLDMARTRLSEAESRLAEAAARVEDSGRDEPQTPEFADLLEALRFAEGRLTSLRRLGEVGAASPVEVQSAERNVTSANAALDAAAREAGRQARSAIADVAAARVTVLGAERALKDGQERLEALQRAAADGWDIEQLSASLAALGYGGPAHDAVRAWQAHLGLAATGIVEPGQLVVASGPVRVAEHIADVGDVLLDVRGGNAADPRAQNLLLNYTGTAKLVTVPLPIADHAMAVVGRSVTVTLPDRREVEGVIAKVGAALSQREETDVTIAIPDQEALGVLEAASVDVEFVSERREGVLAAPVTALLALPGGGFGVELVEGSASRIVPVRTGMFARGRVEIGGDDIAEGVKVGVPG